MDSTYKSNKWLMPLFNIVGVTSTGHTFNSGFCFLQRETQEFFEWALSAFKRSIAVEPKVVLTDCDEACMSAITAVFLGSVGHLCTWHVNKNILKNCRKYFETQANWESFEKGWNRVMYSNTVALYESNWAEFQVEFELYKLALEYLAKQWIVYKEKIVACFTNRAAHLGCRATSRVEGNHHHLKNDENLIRSNLFSVFRNLHRILEAQFVELNAFIQNDKIKINRDHRMELFSKLIGRVSQYALEMVRLTLTIKL